MKKILITLLFIGSISVGSAATPLSCKSPEGGGGVVVLPWSTVKPFPWASIQGIWKTIDSDTKEELFMTFKVTRTTSQIKQLYVEVYEANSCKKVSLRGVGLVNNYEKNIVRVNMNNVFLKLGLFNSSDLDLNRFTCGNTALAATFFPLNGNDESSFLTPHKVKRIENNNDDSRNVILKKVSGSTSFKCRY